MSTTKLLKKLYKRINAKSQELQTYYDRAKNGEDINRLSQEYEERLEKECAIYISADEEE